MASNKLRGAVASMSASGGNNKPLAVGSNMVMASMRPHQNAFSRLASIEPEVEQQKLEEELEEEDTKHIGLPLPSTYANTTVTAAAGLRADRGKAFPGQCDRNQGMLHRLVMADDAEGIEKLAAIRPTGDGTPYIAADLEAVNDAGETPLMAACGAGCNAAVRMLIEVKADLTVRKVTNSFTPLHMACQTGQVETARILIKNGASINEEAYAKQDGGVYRGDKSSPLHCAAVSGSDSLVKLLVKGVEVNKRTVRSDVHAKDTSGRTALHICAANDLVDGIDFLLDAGAEIDGIDNIGETALHAAVWSLSNNAIMQLLRRGADPHKKTGNGIYPIRMAAGLFKNTTQHIAQREEEQRKAMRMASMMGGTMGGKTFKGQSFLNVVRSASNTADRALRTGSIMARQPSLLRRSSIAENEEVKPDELESPKDVFARQGSVFARQGSLLGKSSKWGSVKGMVAGGTFRMASSGGSGSRPPTGAPFAAELDTKLDKATEAVGIFLTAGASLFPEDRLFKDGIPATHVRLNTDNVEKSLNKAAGRGFVTNKEVEKQRRINNTRGLGHVTDAEVAAMRASGKLPSRDGKGTTGSR